MKNQRNLVETLTSLIFLCQFLAEKNVPAYGWTEPAGDETPVPTGHWTATAQNMAARLKRRLTEAEVTLLSLSRGWGPLPWFGDNWRNPIVIEIWSSPNHSGDWLEWEEMGEILEYLLERELFEESLFLELETT